MPMKISISVVNNEIYSAILINMTQSSTIEIHARTYNIYVIYLNIEK